MNNTDLVFNCCIAVIQLQLFTVIGNVSTLLIQNITTTATAALQIDPRTQTSRQ